MPDDSKLETIPVGSLGIIAHKSIVPLGEKVDSYIVKWRKNRQNENKSSIVFHGYEKDSYLIKADCPRFGSGEAKGIVNESVRGKDIYIMLDVGNYSCTYTMGGQTQRMSPDDHYADLKRIISAMTDKPRKITVIMPFLYESRQHKRSGRESLDCAVMLQELQQCRSELWKYDLEECSSRCGSQHVSRLLVLIVHLLKYRLHRPYDNGIPTNTRAMVSPIFVYATSIPRALSGFSRNPSSL